MKHLLSLLIILIVHYTDAQEKTVFDIARYGSLSEMKTIVQQFPDTINTVDERGFSPLILACYRGNKEVAHFLIDNVKNINYKSIEGTALAAISVRYNVDLVQHLLRKKADPNIADNSGTTPLIWAVKTGNEELVKILLEHKASVQKKDDMGITSFEYAVKSQRKNIINLLKSN